MRRLLLILLALVLLTGCDQLFPYDKEPVRVCGVQDTIYADDGSGVVVGIAQVCHTEWRRED